MDDAAEKLAVREVQARLAERFPSLDEDVVQTAVGVAHAELTGPIREFVPVLVEHIARERLASLTGHPDSHLTQEARRSRVLPVGR
jgi:hypothetical protein